MYADHAQHVARHPLSVLALIGLEKAARARSGQVASAVPLDRPRSRAGAGVTPLGLLVAMPLGVAGDVRSAPQLSAMLPIEDEGSPEQDDQDENYEHEDDAHDRSTRRLSAQPTPISTQ